MDALSQWTFIEKTAARDHEVTEIALRKWRVRGVPHRFRLPIMQAATAARVKLDATIFDEPPEFPDKRRKAAA